MVSHAGISALAKARPGQRSRSLFDWRDPDGLDHVLGLLGRQAEAQQERGDLVLLPLVDPEARPDRGLGDD